MATVVFVTLHSGFVLALVVLGVGRHACQHLRTPACPSCGLAPLLGGAALVRGCFVVVLLTDGTFLFVLANSVQLVWACERLWCLGGNVWCV